MIKNNLLSQERSLKRKILEILIAFQLEKEYTKADIMAFYCNSNYYGNNCYGVQGAAEYYFGVDAQSVDWAQAAIIVGTSNSPNRYNPLADYQLCMEKKARVLKQIYDAGHMTEEEYQQALEERPEVVKKNDSIGSESYTTSYAVYCAALKLMEKDNFQFRYTFDSEEEYASYREAYSEVYNNAVNDIRPPLTRSCRTRRKNRTTGVSTFRAPLSVLIIPQVRSRLLSEGAAQKRLITADTRQKDRRVLQSNRSSCTVRD